MNKRIVQTLLLSATAIALSGCGDKVSVEVGPVSEALFELQGLQFKKADIYQLSEKEVAQINNLADEAGKASRIFSSSSDYDAILAADTSFINNADLKKIVDAELNKIKNAQKEDELAWQSNVDKVTRENEPKLTEAKQNLVKAQDVQDKLTSFYAKDAATKVQLEQQIETLSAKKQEMLNKYTDLVRKDIVDLKLPIRMNESYSFSYRTRTLKEGTQCQDYRDLTGFYKDGTCYYLQPNHKDMLNAPSHISGRVLLEEYIGYKLAEESNKDQIRKLQKQINDSKIIGENQLGVKAYRVERDYRDAKNAVERQERTIAQLLSDNKKERFLNDARRTKLRNIDERFESFMTSEAMKTIQTAKHETSDEYQADIPVDINMLSSVLVYEYQGSKGPVSIIVPFNAKQQVKSEQPIIFDLNNKMYKVDASVTPSNRRLQHLLLRG
ncbi:hypothetical protein SBW85_18450 [Vibrio plantisponsor]|jgi:hypothetical protein|uniref:Lipoprotein n=1 Tax=Vibrio plantisponsor TaxID=664643 RepID=A0ABU4IMG3_9VIBR|nr:hypothetical protein [Vibrio plantisponsor]MDW6019686.1 hypothetical protein [Vibrio plantisponsor]NNM38984.1 hypothetical protein [Vibrio plantisponsor]PNH91130.1 hypothetical protein C1M56_02465 [Vibrio diazotrophicus]